MCKSRNTLFVFILGCILWSENALCEDTAGYAPVKSQLTAVTVGDPKIPMDEHTIKLVPLTSEELFAEAVAWFELLKNNVHELASAKLAVKKDNIVLDQKSKQSETTKDSQAAEAELEVFDEKDKWLKIMADIREHRTILIDRLSAVLDEITHKIGHTTEGKEKEEVLYYRRFIKSVGSIQIDVSDTRTARATIISWFTSKEGGIRWADHIRNFLFAVLGFWLIGILLSKLMQKALKLTTHTSVIMKKFIVDTTRRVMIFIGLLVGLSALEINVGPLIAVIGATGFVVAFALQSTLSNFASGLMIMLYRPFDVDDVVDVSGVIGKVKSMTLVTTTIMTPDNKLMVVPNNSIWGNIITNVTGSSVRRVDLVFGTGYEADINRTQNVLEEILAQHPLVLPEPEPQVHLHELAESSVNFVCRPWVKTNDYWTVYWEVTRNVKERFDAEDISIPFPQRDVHVIEHKTV
jgi:small conductance mechanosensitive channel